MSLCREQLDSAPARAGRRKWRKQQLNKYIRRQPLPNIEDDGEQTEYSPQITGSKRKPTSGWEY